MGVYFCLSISYRIGGLGDSQRNFMSKKKIKKNIKSAKKTPSKSPSKKCGRIKSQSKRPVSEYYNLKTNEIYPKLIFREDSWWIRIKRFLGLIP